MSQDAAARTHWHPRSARRCAADRAGLRPLEWRQLEQLVDAGGAWIPAAATAPAGSGLTPGEAVVGLRALRARGLAEYRSDRARAGRWKASETGHQLVMEIRA